jgi:hypothetical protein
VISSVKTVNDAVGISLGAPVLSKAIFQKGANDKIVLALIGSGGRSLGTIISTCKANANVEIKTVCDVKTTRVEPVSNGVTTAREVFDDIQISVLRPEPKLIDKNKTLNY